MGAASSVWRPLSTARPTSPFSSREPTDHEKEVAREAGVEVALYAFARDGVAVIVRADNPVYALSFEETRDVLDGTVTDWAEVGGDPGPIMVYKSWEGGGTVGFVRQVVLDGAPFRDDAIEVRTTAAAVDSVALHKGAIGLAGMAEIDDRVKALPISSKDGGPLSPLNAETVYRRIYALERTFFFGTREYPGTIWFRASSASSQAPEARALSWVPGSFRRRWPCTSAMRTRMTPRMNSLPPVLLSGVLALTVGAFVVSPSSVAAQDADLLAAQGDSLRALGETDPAESRYQAALEIDDRHCRANFGLALLSIARGDRESAEIHTETCEKKKECKDLGLVARGRLLLDANDTAGAEAMFYKASSRDLGDDVRLDLEYAFVDLYTMKGYPSMAKEHLDEVIALSKPDASLHLQKGRMLVEMRQYDEALNAFRESSRIDPSREEAYLEVVDLYRRAKRPADAAATLSALARVRGGAEGYLTAAGAWLDAGRTTDALESYRRATEADSGSVDAWLGLARTAFKTGQVDDAVAAYARIEGHSNLEATDYLSLGRGHLDVEEYEPALSALEKAATLDSTLSDAHFYAGYVHYIQQNFEDGIPYFERAVVLDSTSVSAHVNLGICYLQSGQSEAGIRALETAVALKPEDLDTRVYLAQSVANELQWGRAVREYKSVLEENPDHADALRGLGYCYLNIEQYGPAVNVLAKANRLDPGNVQGMVWLAQGFGMANELEKSESMFRKVLAIDPNSRDAKEGLALLQEGRKGRS